YLQVAKQDTPIRVQCESLRDHRTHFSTSPVGQESPHSKATLNSANEKWILKYVDLKPSVEHSYDSALLLCGRGQKIKGLDVIIHQKWRAQNIIRNRKAFQPMALKRMYPFQQGLLHFI